MTEIRQGGLPSPHCGFGRRGDGGREFAQQGYGAFRYPGEGLARGSQREKLALETKQAARTTGAKLQMAGDVVAKKTQHAAKKTGDDLKRVADKVAPPAYRAPAPR